LPQADRTNCSSSKRSRHATFEDDDLERLDQLIAAHPYATLEELRDMSGTTASIMSVKRASDRLGYRLKKTLHASEQEREDVKRKRELWMLLLPSLDPDKLVFLDESGVKTNMTRLRGRARHGLRLFAHAPHTVTGARLR
jgi:hypothetical protein